MQQWVSSREEDDKAGGKRLYYISIEFLLRRMLFNNALNLLCTENYTKALTELELSWKDIFYEEPEPGLGNGGLGRHCGRSGSFIKMSFKFQLRQRWCERADLMLV